ncbi:SnoaL-like domain-containing protein [Aestuariibius sp. 2305UL40-4]|uniref:SnoaL-like domain-containing protein n=1 Tax=Aestuariibius violaceus TaxID=3234132 RepID=UPI00345EA821
MGIMEIGNELVKGCREGREMENLDRLYAADAVSVEAADMQGMGREAPGLEAIRGKHQWWESNFEVIEPRVEGPYPHGEDRFAVMFGGKFRNKESGEISDMNEIAVYHVKNDKIVREEFFYPTEA